MRALVSEIPRSGTAEMPNLDAVTTPELQSYLERLFSIGDKDGNGVLDAVEFEGLLRKSGFNFDSVTIRRIMNAADVNQDGVIQYEEFVPAMLSILKSAPLPEDEEPAAEPAPEADPAPEAEPA